jgi:hypothetical protein
MAAILLDRLVIGLCPPPSSEIAMHAVKAAEPNCAGRF